MLRPHTQCRRRPLLFVAVASLLLAPGMTMTDATLALALQDARPIGQAMIGVVFDQSSDQAIVSQLYVGGPAEMAGLRSGDRIVALNGQRVMSSREVIEFVARSLPSQRVELTVQRGEWTTRVSILLADRSSMPNLAPVRSAVSPPQRERRLFSFQGLGYVDGERARNIDDPYRRALYTNFGN